MGKEKKLTTWIERISARALSALKLKNTVKVCLEPVGTNSPHWTMLVK